VDPARLGPLSSGLPQAVGEPLDLEKLKSSLRQLFATGLYEDIQVEGSPDGDGVDLVFRGAPRAFIGMVSVLGAKGATLNAQLQHASQLAPGSRYTAAKLSQALEQMRRTLAANGFNGPTITQTLTPHPRDQLVDIAFQVVSGPQARVGSVQVTGDPGMSLEEFRRHAHLRAGSHVDHDTASRALAESSSGTSARSGWKPRSSSKRSGMLRPPKRMTSDFPQTPALKLRSWWKASA